jgi:hypothetical protein
MLGNCGGQVAPLVAYIAIDKLSDEDFFVAEVLGMTHSSETGSKGYLIIVKRRCGNATSNAWMHNDYFIPQIKRADDLNTNLEGGKMKSSLYIDGEACVLAAGMTPATQAAYFNADIVGAKGYTSGTSKHQLWDVSTCFKDMHAGVALINSKGTNVKDDLLRAGLEEAFKKFKTQFPTITISKDRREKIIHGMEVFVFATKRGTITAPKLKAAAEQCGQHTSGEPVYKFPGLQKTTIDIRKIISLCPTHMSDDQIATFERNLPELVDDCQRNGRSSDTLMDDLGIVKSKDHASREGLYISRQNPFFFTHDNNVNAYTVRIT